MHVARVEDRKTIDLIVPRTGGDTADIPSPSGKRQTSHEGAILALTNGPLIRRMTGVLSA
jgi:hypothetical protein